MKTVFIAGGSRGIGRAMVKAFALNGCKTYFCYNKSESEALSLAHETGAHAVKCDVSNELEISKALQSAGKVDILIYNAGVSHTALLTDTTVQHWDNLFDVNVKGAYLFAKMVLPEMIRQKNGCIINIASMWGEVGASCEVAYSASKAALIGFTKALAKEVGPSNIRVNAISPGVIHTDMLNEYTQDDLNALKYETPLGRLGTPEDIAAAALSLASEGMSFITGQVIGVNGGFVI